MMWADKFRLNKQLVRSLTDQGHNTPTALQQKVLGRIIGGQNVVAIAPEGSGKTTTLVIAALNRFNYKADGVPRVLILTAGQEDVFAIMTQFERLNKNTSIRIVTLHSGAGIEQQMDDLADGADIVIATPDRARAVYLKLGLNLNKIELFALDDAHLIVKQGLQLPVAELANSIVKAQRLVFTEVMHDKLERMIAPFTEDAATVEVEDLPSAPIVNTHQQLLYQVPNFGTKLNLLNLFVQDEEVFTRLIVFVNTQQTAETIYQGLQKRERNAAALLGPAFFEYRQVNSTEEFKADPGLRILIAAADTSAGIAPEAFPFIIHFDIPADKQTYIDRVVKQAAADSEDVLALTFATDIELDLVRKIEQATGQKMQEGELPDELVIAKSKAAKEAEKEKRPSKPDPNKYVPGEAFHAKKPENSKTYNYSSGEKAKMNKKRKHG